jgi:hypothetical protein
MESPIYTERQPMQFRGLIAAMVFVLLIVSAVLGKGQAQEVLWTALLSAALIAAIWFLTIFRIVVTSREVRFGYPFWRKRLALDVVRVGDIERISAWAGIGIHYWLGKWVFNAHFGRGVMLRTERASYLVGSLEPEKFQNALLNLARRQGTP